MVLLSASRAGRPSGSSGMTSPAIVLGLVLCVAAMALLATVAIRGVESSSAKAVHHDVSTVLTGSGSNSAEPSPAEYRIEESARGSVRSEVDSGESLSGAPDDASIVTGNVGPAGAVALGVGMDLEARLSATEEHLEALSRSAHQARFLNGLGVFVGPAGGKGAGVSSTEAENLVAIHADSSGYYKTTLPREEYPELYELKATIKDLKAEIAATSSKEDR